MAFIIGLAHHIKSRLVTEVIELGTVGIMGGSHRVDIVPAHHPQIPLNMLDRHYRTGIGVAIVAINPFDFDGAAVEL